MCLLVERLIAKGGPFFSFFCSVQCLHMKRIILATLFLIAVPSFAFAANIDATSKYARFLNTGTLINFGATNGNVTVTNTAVTGNAWSSANGWINLAPTQGGVVNDGHGVLSGYAWGENTGWINFKPTNGGVTIDSAGDFHGYAWSESKGWIVFNCATDSTCGTLSHKVKTTWVPPTTTTITAGGSGWVNTINSQIPQQVSPPLAEVAQPDLPVPSEVSTPQEQVVTQAPQVESVPQDSVVTTIETNDNGGVAPATEEDEAVSSPTFQDKVFGVATKTTDEINKSFSDFKVLFVNLFASLKNILDVQVLGAITLGAIALTTVVAVALLFALSRISTVVSVVPKIFAIIGALSLHAWASIKWARGKEKISPEPAKEATENKPVPLIDVPVETAPSTKSDTAISWTINPQPVVMQTNETPEVLQRIIPEKLKDQVASPVSVVQKATVKNATEHSLSAFTSLFINKKPIDVPPLGNEPARSLPGGAPEIHPDVAVLKSVPTQKEQKKSFKDFLSLFIRKAPAVVEKVDMPPSPPQNVVVDESVASVAIASSVAPTEAPKPSSFIEPVKLLQNTPSAWARFTGKVKGFSQRTLGKIRHMRKKVTPQENIAKRVWNPRPPTGAD